MVNFMLCIFYHNLKKKKTDSLLSGPQTYTYKMVTATRSKTNFITMTSGFHSPISAFAFNPTSVSSSEAVTSPRGLLSLNC